MLNTKRTKLLLSVNNNSLVGLSVLLPCIYLYYIFTVSAYIFIHLHYVSILQAALPLSVVANRMKLM